MKKFTLIELLVVVAIIGILASILMPSLQSAREKTKRAVCLSNQNQVYKGMAVFSVDNSDTLPIGHAHNYQFDYIIFDKRYEIFGILVKNQIIEAPKAFYCPSQKSVWRSYDTDINPWLQSGKLTRAAFNARPFLNGTSINWGSSSDADLDDGNFSFLPDMGEFNGEAVITGAISHKGDKKSSHDGDGRNAIFSDGAGKWVKFGSWSSNIDSAGTPFSNGNNASVQSVWEGLDEYR